VPIEAYRSNAMFKCDFNALSSGSKRYLIRWHCNALQIVNMHPGFIKGYDILSLVFNKLYQVLFWYSSLIYPTRATCMKQSSVANECFLWLLVQHWLTATTSQQCSTLNIDLIDLSSVLYSIEIWLDHFIIKYLGSNAETRQTDHSEAAPEHVYKDITVNEVA